MCVFCHSCWLGVAQPTALPAGHTGSAWASCINQFYCKTKSYELPANYSQNHWRITVLDKILRYTGCWVFGFFLLLFCFCFFSLVWFPEQLWWINTIHHCSSSLDKMTKVWWLIVKLCRLKHLHVLTQVVCVLAWGLPEYGPFECLIMSISGLFLIAVFSTILNTGKCH